MNAQKIPSAQITDITDRPRALRLDTRSTTGELLAARMWRFAKLARWFQVSGIGAIEFQRVLELHELATVLHKYGCISDTEFTQTQKAYEAFTQPYKEAILSR